MSRSRFLHPVTCGWTLRRFHLLAFMKHAAVNTCVRAPVRVLAFRCSVRRWEVDSGSYVILCLTFSGATGCFPRQPCGVAAPPTAHKGSSFPHPCQHLLLLLRKHACRRPGRCGAERHRGFIRGSLMTKEVEHFSCACWPFVSFGEMSLQVLCPRFNFFYCFFFEL